MQKGYCTNFGNCSNANVESDDVVEVPEGTDFVCPECGSQLTPVPEGGGGLSGIWGKVPVPARIAGAVIVGLGLLAGGYTLLSSGTSDAAQAANDEIAGATNAPTRPDSSAVRAALRKDLSGYEIASTPSFAGKENGRFTYNVVLRPTETRYEVPVIDFTPPDGWDEEARELSQHIVFADALPAGKVYDADARSERNGEASRIEAEWSGRFDAAEGARTFVGGGRLTLDEEQASSETDPSVLTAGALKEAEREQKAAAEQFAQQWQRLQERVAKRRASLRQSLPPPCTEDTDPLIREITRLSSDECPSLSGEERKQCYLKVQKLNSKLGDCETRNQVRAEARRGMSGKIARYRRQQIDTLRQKLKQAAAPAPSASS